MCTVSRRAEKIQRWTTWFIIAARWAVLRSTFLRICSWTHTGRICVIVEWCVLHQKKVAATLVKFIHEWDSVGVTHKNCTTWDHKFDMTMNQNRESDLFLWIIPHWKQNRESDTFFFYIKQSHISTVSCLWIGTSDEILFPCYYTLGVSFARKTLDPRKDFHFTHYSQGGWAKYPSASKSIKLVFGCHLILHQCFSAFQTHKCRIYPW